MKQRERCTHTHVVLTTVHLYMEFFPNNGMVCMESEKLNESKPTKWTETKQTKTKPQAFANMTVTTFTMALFGQKENTCLSKNKRRAILFTRQMNALISDDAHSKKDWRFQPGRVSCMLTHHKDNVTIDCSLYMQKISNKRDWVKMCKKQKTHRDYCQFYHCSIGAPSVVYTNWPSNLHNQNSRSRESLSLTAANVPHVFSIIEKLSFLWPALIRFNVNKSIMYSGGTDIDNTNWRNVCVDPIIQHQKRILGGAEVTFSFSFLR